MHVFIIILTILCRLKIAELKKRQVGDTGFINTNLIDATQVKYHAENTEANLLRSLVVNENEDIIRQIQKISEKVINQKLAEKSCNFNDLKTDLINELLPFLSEKTGRIPIILPIIMDIKNYSKQ